MNLRVSLLAALVGLAIVAPSADAAAPKCDRGGAKVLTMSGKTSVVSITSRSKDDVTAYGCWIPTGKRFKLFGDLDSDEATEWSIVGGRYIGVLRTFMGGVGGGGTAAKSWDARKRIVVHDARACDGIVENPDDEESGTAGGPCERRVLPRRRHRLHLRRQHALAHRRCQGRADARAQRHERDLARCHARR